jgi:hypothetical protein
MRGRLASIFQDHQLSGKKRKDGVTAKMMVFRHGGPAKMRFFTSCRRGLLSLSSVRGATSGYLHDLHERFRHDPGACGQVDFS